MILLAESVLLGTIAKKAVPGQSRVLQANTIMKRGEASVWIVHKDFFVLSIRHLPRSARLAIIARRTPRLRRPILVQQALLIILHRVPR